MSKASAKSRASETVSTAMLIIFGRNGPKVSAFTYMLKNQQEELNTRLFYCHIKNHMHTPHIILGVSLCQMYAVLFTYYKLRVDSVCIKVVFFSVPSSSRAAFTLHVSILHCMKLSNSVVVLDSGYAGIVFPKENSI